MVVIARTRAPEEHQVEAPEPAPAVDAPTTVGAST
jgi:hypothetical protein